MALEPERPDAPAAPGRSSSNSVSGTVHGPVAQIGVVHGDVNLVTGAPVRTRYREQVRRIAPRELVGREAELADLASFCTSSATPYRWLRASAWSGKSALMSTFVLNSPPGVRVVSFFVTARLSSQNDQGAFIENVLEQLVAILGQDLPPLLTESTREAHLLGLLTEVAEACRDRGEHFVLLVDGLDEDRGVTTGPDAHSIAALLPLDPPAGMKVIVAGRPDPPIPTDVPHHHPLRDPAVVRSLTTSAAAQAERADMERELKRLLHGTDTDQALLGLLTAAGGGLSAADLADLTGATEREVNDHLRTVAGRSFGRREGRYRRDREMYVLGHEELHREAVDLLGPRRLAEYRDRVHSWVDDYRKRDWPADSPDYLLSGYHALLVATNDLDRMVTLCTDRLRQDLLCDVSGGDAAALAEIAETRSALMADDDPQLTALLRLAVHRDRLHARATAAPELPGLWAEAGFPDRAVALASALPEGQRHDRAWHDLAAVAATRGDLKRAVECADRVADFRSRCAVLCRIAEAFTRDDPAQAKRVLARVTEDVFHRSPSDLDRNRAAVRLARTAIAMGEFTSALAVTFELPPGGNREDCLFLLVETTVKNDPAWAEEVLRLFTKPAALHAAVHLVLRQWAERGDAGRILAVPELFDDPVRRAGAAVLAANVLPLAGALDGVIPPAGIASAPEGWHDLPDEVLAAAAASLATLGAGNDAEALVTAIRKPRYLSLTLKALTDAALSRDDRPGALSLLGKAEALLDRASKGEVHRHTMTWMIDAALAAGAPDRARALLARAEAAVAVVEHRNTRYQALSLAKALAIRIRDDARTRARPAVHGQGRRELPAGSAPKWRVQELLRTSAEESAHLSPIPPAIRCSVIGVPQDKAASALREVEAEHRGRSDAEWRGRVLKTAVNALLRDKQETRAETVALSIVDEVARIDALITVLSRRKGDVDHARRLLSEALDTARSIPGARARDDALSRLAHLTSLTGDPDTTVAVISDITTPSAQGSALVTIGHAPLPKKTPPSTLPNMDGEVATVLKSYCALRVGNREDAARLVRAVTTPELRDAAVRPLVRDALKRAHWNRAVEHADHAAGRVTRLKLWREVAQAMIDAGHVDAAVDLVGSLPEQDADLGAVVACEAALAAVDLSQALAVAREVSGQVDRERLLGKVAAVAARAAVPDLPEVVLFSDVEPTSPLWPLVTVVTSLGAAGDAARVASLLERAEVVARGVGVTALREPALAMVVQSLLVVGAVDRAEALASSITDAGRRGDALLGVVVKLLERGAVRAATDAAETVSAVESGKSFTEAAARLPTVPARRLTARLLGGVAWRRAAAFVMGAAPDALDAVLADLAER